ncbi:MAG: hypothetical protein JWQ09_5803 [Segetibacter sp.]|nr:hypothetical protein [Segetibacter sp.]
MKIITKGKSALIEYPPLDNPEFEFDNKGVLFVHGYKMKFMAAEIGMAKRADTGLKGYNLIGKYNDCIINKDIKAIVNSTNLDLDNCIILTKDNA